MSRSFTALCKLSTVFIKKLWITRKWPSKFENVRICEEGKSEVLKEKPSGTAGDNLRSRCRFLFFVGRARERAMGERRSRVLSSFPLARARPRNFSLCPLKTGACEASQARERTNNINHTLCRLRDLILAHFNGRRVLASLRELSDLAVA